MRQQQSKSANIYSNMALKNLLYTGTGTGTEGFTLDKTNEPTVPRRHEDPTTVQYNTKSYQKSANY